MEVKERLRLVGDGCDGQAALMVVDEGVEYPLFFESLHNTVYFPLLIESGYTLTEYPYNFVKNGVSIKDLPIRDFAPSEQDLQNMYDSIGVKVPIEEIKSKIETPLHVLETPPTEYKIHTREAFIEYLETIENVKLADDYLPINYFVSPEARFSAMEYNSAEFARYVQIMNNRREMTTVKFNALVKWLQSHGLSQSHTVTDIIDAYFAWGVDGLNASFINKYRKRQEVSVISNIYRQIPIIKTTTGFIDSNGNFLIPQSQRNVAWSISANGAAPSAKTIADRASRIAPGKVEVCTFYAPASIDVIVLEAPSYSVKIAADNFVVGESSYPTFSVIDPSNYAAHIPLEMMLPENTTQLYTHAVLSAIANSVYERKRGKFDLSSKDVLTLMGLDPSEILEYFKEICSGVVPASSSDDMSSNMLITGRDISSYLAGKQVDEKIQDFFDDVLSGMVNVDNVNAAITYESSNSIDSVYKLLYALHHVFGIPVEDIYEKIRTSTQEAVFEHDGLSISLDLRESKALYNAYMHDITDNEITAAETCVSFLMVTRVARELGNDECKRHVGFEGFAVAKNRASSELMYNIEAEYANACEYNVTDATARADLLKKKKVFAAFAFFEAAIKGQITMPPAVGGTIKRLSNAEIIKYRQCMSTVIESTAAFCDRQLDMSRSKVKYRCYCVNAYITPEYIIPKVGQTLTESSFYALWKDWSKTPAIYGALLERGIITTDFVPWEYRYCDCGYDRYATGELKNDDSLYKYYVDAQQFINDFMPGSAWTSVPHPIEKMYPGLFVSDGIDAFDEAHEVDKPNVRVGLTFKRTFNDYRDIVFHAREEDERDQYIRQFCGFDAEELISDPTLILKEPRTTGMGFYVHRGSETIRPADGTEYVDFRRLCEFDSNKYNYIHVYGRKYLLRDVNDKLWEVTI